MAHFSQNRSCFGVIALNVFRRARVWPQVGKVVNADGTEQFGKGFEVGLRGKVGFGAGHEDDGQIGRLFTGGSQSIDGEQCVVDCAKLISSGNDDLAIQSRDQVRHGIMLSQGHQQPPGTFDNKPVALFFDRLDSVNHIAQADFFLLFGCGDERGDWLREIKWIHFRIGQFSRL